MPRTTLPHPTTTHRRSRTTPQQARRPWKVIIALVTVSLLGAIVAAFALRPPRSPDVAVPEVIEGVVSTEAQAQDHLAAPVAYEQIPPKL